MNHVHEEWRDQSRTYHRGCADSEAAEMSLCTVWAQAVECTKRHDGCSPAGVGFGTEPGDFLDMQVQTHGIPADGLVGAPEDDLGTSDSTLGMQFERERGIGLGEAHEATLDMGPDLERGIVLGQGPDTDLEEEIDIVLERELETGLEEEFESVPEHELDT